MPDKDEVEIKFVLENPEKIRETLIELGAESHGRHYESSLRLDDSSSSLASKGMSLRVRSTTSIDPHGCLVTLKMPTRDEDSEFKVRREVEFTVSDFRAVLTTMNILGFSPYLQSEKWRETLTLADLTVCLDELPFGWFMELEGPKESIRTTANELGLRMSDGLTLGYVQIFNKVRKALNLPTSDITFKELVGVHINPAIYRQM
jgi:adenylate cyclase, class 2